MAEIISTVNNIHAGKDSALEIVKDNDKPLHDVDQSKTCSTRTMVPNKREVDGRDVENMIKRLKGENIESPKEKIAKNQEDKIENSKEEVKEEKVMKRKNKRSK